MAIISNGTTVASGGSLQNVPAPTSSQVASSTSGISVGAVGSYGFCGRGSAAPGTYIRAGSTTGASNIEWSSGSGSIDTIATNPSGTWRCMGYCAWDAAKSSLWLRIS